MEFGILIFVVLAWLIGLGLTILGIVFWIWMLIDCLKYEPSEGNDKVIWVLVIVLLNWVGALVYYIVRRPERIKQMGQ
ncbi:MAG TPA: hypothetical protein DCM07_18955 [Planctomycetaceae bacterium]|uniref:PLD nuclease N-terminal domain-containing protein n=1 Tax=Gimesia sp. TaxID=2024833 RepID=UPI000C4CD6FB|nr:PLD nuclease N-terminal domain-containing protein [Gimesia sp.]MAX35729.1 hypothetical protein [Gimesia sp.]HAH46886.1 hypothetical protein [Planctomycetaceae bacterium]HBL47686.1 hypothetical protein [Planctomycetaceae bacterium]|tara:strand:+ start:19849 stop:20082 length:234 start_codon:yes stop_codon:yes gene_type:complete